MNLLEKIQEAGIVGQGGAGFPAHVKLDAKVEYLLINALECEPLLFTDKHIINNYAHQIVEAILVIKNHLDARQAVIGIKAINAKEVAAMEKAINDLDADVQIHQSHNYYPSGDEQMLVYDVTKRTVPQGGIPLNVGCVVTNVGTLLEINRAIGGNGAVTHKFLTVTGEVGLPSVIKVPIGASFTDCIAACHGTLLTNYKIIDGGPFMGKIYNKEEESNLFVRKTTSSIIVTKDDNNINAKIKDANLKQVLNRARAACIQCRACTDLCPRHLVGHRLHPHKVMRAMAAANFEGESLNSEYIHENRELLEEALICCECGICETYACPMELLPRQINVFVKMQFLKEGLKYENRKLPYPPHPVREYRKPTAYSILARMGLYDLTKIRVENYIEHTPAAVRVSLSQHIGKPAVAVVSSGDMVEVGQLIGKADGKVSANIHAGIRGKVVEVADYIEIEGVR
ncbi:MAG: 4Fe-4S dicluster domain-containing protein [Defluviitaleaceae bacterium]|nr:4Fe-4S dicluster domain-containing protein [Defluviitaleaceae bacterium]